MHRLLLAFEDTAVVVYSLNKDRVIQTINFKENDSDKGKALAADFLDSSRIAVAYSSGVLALYKAESSSQKPFKVFRTELEGIYQMQLQVVTRDSYSSLVL